MRLLGTFAATVLLVGSLQALESSFPLLAQQLPPGAPAESDVRSIAGRFAVMSAPAASPSAFMTETQALTAAQIEMRTVDVDGQSSTWGSRRAVAVTAPPAAGPRAGTETVPRDALTSPLAPGDPSLRLDRRVVPLAPSLFGLAVRMVAEPSVAVSDGATWATGNWFAARSTDAGVTWSYVNPYADFPTFASDQDTVYDPQRHAFFWYRQGAVVPGRLENSVRLNVSTDGAASWCGFTLRPSDIDPSWLNLNLDYPHLALSDNFLYISSMLVVTGGGFATPRMILLRLPLDDLAGCQGFRYTYWSTDEGWSWTPVENGATTAMYLGDTLNAGSGEETGTFRVYVQPENSNVLSFVDRAVPAWTFTERNGLCAVAGDGNPCARTDHRITSGWVRQRPGGAEIGFLWNVREGGGFPHPYIDGVTFDRDTLLVTGRPLVWDSRCAWQYGAVAPNGRELGIAAFHFCPAQAPAHAIGVADLTDGQLSWAMTYSRTGDVPTATRVWGDYIRVRPMGRGFLATGYTIGASGADPFLVTFARRAPAGSDDSPQNPEQNPRQ